MILRRTRDKDIGRYLGTIQQQVFLNDDGFLSKTAEICQME